MDRQRKRLTVRDILTSEERAEIKNYKMKLINARSIREAKLIKAEIDKVISNAKSRYLSKGNDEISAAVEYSQV